MVENNLTFYWDYLGRTDFESCFSLQSQIRESILKSNSPNTVVLTEHDKTFTLGRRESGDNLLVSKDLLEKRGFKVIKTTRGGMITYHGPGQLLIYPILDLRKLSLKVKEYVKKLEQTVIDTLNRYGIQAERKEGYPGVWVLGKKIGSLGIHVKKMVTMHGFALNVFTDINDFKYINPCGFKNLEVTSMKNEGVNSNSLEIVAKDIINSFSKIFGVEIKKSTLLTQPSTTVRVATI